MTLDQNFSVMCGPLPFFDSWLLVEVDQIKILNLNDCVINTVEMAESIFEQTGPVNTLLTQFSYANWEGNPEQKIRREKASENKLSRLKIQAKTLKEKYVIPFASFIYFSHEENFFLNDSSNSIQSTHDFCIQETKSTPVILYPGEDWHLGKSHHNQKSLDLYKKDAEQIPNHQLHKSKSVAIPVLIHSGTSYLDSIKEKNSSFLIKLMSLPPLNYFLPVTFFLTDHNCNITFNINHGLITDDILLKEHDVLLHSENLFFILNQAWGLDTLNVNGRFRADQKGFQKLIKTFSLGPLNNTGRYLTLSMFLDFTFLKIVLQKLFH